MIDAGFVLSVAIAALGSLDLACPNLTSGRIIFIGLTSLIGIALGLPIDSADGFGLAWPVAVTSCAVLAIVHALTWNFRQLAIPIPASQRERSRIGPTGRALIRVVATFLLAIIALQGIHFIGLWAIRLINLPQAPGAQEALFAQALIGSVLVLVAVEMTVRMDALRTQARSLRLPCK